MTKRLSNLEVIEQLERFNHFMATADLVRLGRRYYHMVANDAKDGRFTPYCYLLRVLSILAKVEGTCGNPDTFKSDLSGQSYREILQDAAVTAMIDWFNANWEAVREITEDMQKCVNTDMTICSGSGVSHTPKQILWHIQNLTKFGRKYVENFVEGKKILASIK